MKYEYTVPAALLIITVIANGRNLILKGTHQVFGIKDQPAVHWICKLYWLLTARLKQPIVNLRQRRCLCRDLSTNLNLLLVHTSLRTLGQGGEVQIGTRLILLVHPQLIAEHQIKQKEGVDQYIFGSAPMHYSSSLSGYYCSISLSPFANTSIHTGASLSPSSVSDG
ncbi:hypothetical protein D3C85_918170 [compost metagenome]